MDRLKKLLEKRWAAYTAAACIAVLLYMFLSNISPVLSGIRSVFRALSPILIGIVLAYLIDPIAKFFNRTVFSRVKKELKSRIFSVVLALVCVLAAIVLFFVILVPAIIDSAKDFIGNSSYYYDRIQWLIDYINNLDIGFNLDLEDLINSLRNVISETFLKFTSDFSSFLSSLSSFGSRIFNWIVGFIMAAYFLLGKKGLLAGLDRLRRTTLTKEKYERNNIFWRRCHEIFINFIGCDLLDAFIIGIANAVFMSFSGMNNIALISLVVGVTNLLPTFGPLIGGIIGAVILLLSSVRHCIYFIIFTIILQTVDGYIIKPRLFGSSLGIPAVWTLIAIIIGGKLFGVVGIIISIPLAAVIAIIYKEQVIPWLEERKMRKIRRTMEAEAETADTESINADLYGSCTDESEDTPDNM